MISTAKQSVLVATICYNIGNVMAVACHILEVGTYAIQSFFYKKEDNICENCLMVTTINF